MTNLSPAEGAPSETEWQPEDESQKVLLYGKFWPVGGRKPTWRESLAVVVGIVSTSLNIICSIVTLSIPGKFFVWAFTVIGFVTCPAMVWAQTEMTKLDTFRDVLNDFREAIEVFRGENDKLVVSIDNLSGEVDRLKEVEEGLGALTEAQGGNVGQLVDLIKENGKILTTLQEVVKARALQDIVNLVFECDSSGDFELSPEELDRLVLGLSLMDTIEFDEDEFRRKISVTGRGGSIEGVLEVIKGLMGEEEEENSVKRGSRKSLISVKRHEGSIRK